MASPMSKPEPNFVMVAPDPATEGVERLRRQALRLLSETHGEDGPEPPTPDRDGARRDNAPSSSTAPSMIVGVLAMPAVFLAIVFVALWLFGKPGEDAPALAVAPPTTEQTTLSRAAIADPAGAEGVIALADEAHIRSIALDGDRIALHVEGPSGRQIVVYDYREGREVAVAAIETFSTEATDTLSMLTGPPPAAPAVTVPPPAVASAEAATETSGRVYTGTPRVKPRSTP